MTITVEDKFIIAIVGTLATAAVEVIWKPFSKSLAPLIKDWFEQRIRRGQKKVYDGKAILSTILLSMENLDFVISAVQLQTKNGGGLPKAGSPLYGSVISPAKYSESFRNQLLDGPYCQMISQLISDKKLKFVTEELPFCILKDLNLAHDIKAAVWFDIMINKKEYNFICINLEKPYSELPPATRDEIRKYMQTCKDIINQ